MHTSRSRAALLPLSNPIRVNLRDPRSNLAVLQAVYQQHVTAFPILDGGHPVKAEPAWCRRHDPVSQDISNGFEALPLRDVQIRLAGQDGGPLGKLTGVIQPLEPTLGNKDEVWQVGPLIE